MARFLFNTTFTVDDNLRDAWLKWMVGIYIPAMRTVAPGCSHELYDIDGASSEGSHSFSSQWRCDSLFQLGNLRSTSAQLCQDVMQTMGESCLAFSTLMRGLNIGEE